MKDLESGSSILFFSFDLLKRDVWVKTTYSQVAGFAQQRLRGLVQASLGQLKSMQKPGTRTNNHLKTGWWFQTFFIFIPIWGRFPF